MLCLTVAENVIDFYAIFCLSLQVFCNSIAALLVVVVINRGPEFWYLFTWQYACVIRYSDDTILPHFRPKFGNPLFPWYVLFFWWINGNRTLWRMTDGFCDVFFHPFPKITVFMNPSSEHAWTAVIVFPALPSVKTSLLLRLFVIVT